MSSLISRVKYPNKHNLDNKRVQSKKHEPCSELSISLIMELQSILLLLPLIISLPFCSSSTDTIRFNESLADGQVLVSSGEKYTLGFFRPGSSRNRYLGIWFTKLPTRVVVWVANRDNPINDTTGSLSIDAARGGLILQQGSRNMTTPAPLWSTNVSTAGQNPVVARLLDEGNLVLLQQQQDGDQVLWQSFDHPTDTVLPNMVRKTGPDYAVRSWKSPDDPAAGDWSYVLESNGSPPQLMLYEGRTKRWRSGPWNGVAWSGVPDMSRITFFNISVVVNDSDSTFVWGLRNDPTLIARVYLDPEGILNRAIWQDKDARWNEIFRYPKETCDWYGHCGQNGNCDQNKDAGAFFCSCLPGFEPRSLGDWYLRDGSGGCARKRTGSLSCGRDGGGDGFVKLENAKVPDTTTGRLYAGMDLKNCEQECLRNCSCTAYASSNLTSGIGCIVLYGDLMDTRVFAGGGQDVYVRVNAAELAEYRKRLKGDNGKKKVLAIALASVAAAIMLVVSVAYYCLWRRKRKGNKEETNRTIPKIESESEKESLYEDKDSSVPIFDVLDIFAATKDFSLASKLGQGGFGTVYKGVLSSGQEIAVKRLSQTSRQGIREFKNEVRLVSKLQHKNLARLFGCCIHGEDKMLIYEYLSNRSLDLFIFDSRLKIIHRDLKASNVLLDAAMNPKISDFGMARLFGEDQIEANTNRIVGTYGYMSPEYAMEGLYSTKSDVFSFGVLTLEIVSSRRSNQCYQESPSLSLIGHVWELWREGRALEIVDPSTMGESCSIDQIMRCIQIGLLCVQESPSDRPTMSNVVFMLGNETTLPSPGKPAFILQRKHDDANSVATNVTGSSTDPSTNQMSITTLVAR
ncbi:unnamed protein product [Linum tenue]|uniref:Receptor-like serine/threonine-protein kinase n=1 Tax=Linum tenue TaxID=586396 RepID=A0AAV0LAA1_9ROSI|nr:unnamed protein product [Linum tenue]